MKKYTKAEDPQNLWGDAAMQFEKALIKEPNYNMRLQMFVGFARDVAEHDDDASCAMYLRSLLSARRAVEEVYRRPAEVSPGKLYGTPENPH